MARKPKFTPKKKKTLVPEPKWDKLRKAKTEEQKYAAWLECDDFVRHEITDREVTHAIRRWIELESGWDLAEEAKKIPETFLSAYAKNGWKARTLGYMPQSVRDNLEKNLRPTVAKAFKLREAIVEPGYDFTTMEDDHPWHPTKVKEWVKKWQSYMKSLDPDSNVAKIRMEYQIAHTYVQNMNAYLRNGVWLDTHWGENRENRCVPVCKVMAYHPDGTVKRTVGTWYSDVQGIWTKEMELECNSVN